MKVSLDRNVFCVWLVLFLLLVISPRAVHSQVIQTPSTEEQRRRAQDEAEERQRLQNQPNVELGAKTQTESFDTFLLPDESPCFALQRLTLAVSEDLPAEARRVGASALKLDPFYFAQEYLNHYEGQCVGKVGLNIIIQRLSNFIVSKGFSTTRVGIAEQNLASGDLIVSLVPGTIRAIRFSDPDLFGTWRNAFPVADGDLLDLRDLEQGLEQMKRVTSQDVTLQLVPAQNPGETDVVLVVTRNKALKFSTSLDNSGAKGTGQYVAGGGLSMDNLLGLSDQFHIGVNSNASRHRSGHGSTGQNGSYSVPFGYWNLSASASNSDYFQTIPGVSGSFVSSGNSKNMDAKASYLFHRDQTQKNSIQVDIGKRWSNAYLDDTEIGVQKRNVTSVELAWIHKHYFDHAQLDLTLANRWGSQWLHGQSDLENWPEDQPTFLYSIQTLDATVTAPFQIAELPVTYIGTLRAQTTRSPLYLSEQFSIGGRYTVRGFDGDLTLAAERGFYVRNELDMPIGQTSHSAYVGVDVGRVFGPSVEYLIGDKLAGATLGLRGAYQKVSYDVFSSWPLYKPQEFKTAKPTIGFSLSVQY